MKMTFTGAICAIAILSGCAATDSTSPAQQTATTVAQADAPAAKRYDYEATTGSRLPPRKTHERLVKSTEGGDYRKDNPTESLGNTLNSTINK